ncbi:Leukotoxin translocation ATP-binding LktB [Gossypium arboreum]|uniref:Leukotoxin translocation ATP-binding LktB n=1 Tax=Gossypium arboreum TaxID=29729 RepID=A0A0B0PN04_GOSAR|nr:Leukotoxin translocation ATP-binding LktB [Gossypium arboreum]
MCICVYVFSDSGASLDCPTSGWVFRHMLRIPDSLSEQHYVAMS